MQLQRDSYYDFPAVLTLSSGEEVRIAGLHQQPTYVNLLLGKPRPEHNDGFIADTCKVAATVFHRPHPYLITPTRRVYDKFQDGEAVEWLPPVACIADLRSADAGLTILWFQWAYALPIEPEPLRQLLDVDWRSHSQEEEP